MASLYEKLNPQLPSQYWDKQYFRSQEEFSAALKASSTLYLGNLSFYTTEEQIHELFSRCGSVKRIIMGLDKFKKTPCGFSFVEFYNRGDAADGIKYLNGSRLDDRQIRTDWDPGFRDGRQYGRGISGGQIRDEYRQDFDPARGGYGAIQKRGPPQQPVKRKHEEEEGAVEANAPPAKRQKTGSDNPRFREKHESDEEV